MNTTDSAMNLCKQCGQPMAGDAPEGLCARCLISVAMKEPEPPTGATPRASAPASPLPADIPDIGDAAEVARRLPQFEIMEMLGRGGMGVVYKARQLALDRMVALKILPPVDALTPDFVERFRREARSLAKLSHPNIVAVHDFGESGGLYFFAMEFVDGVNLREMIRTGKMTPAEALAVVPKICDALQFAHEEGVVHRDIKPENILIDKRGRVKIADFGLAKLLRREATDHTLTMSGMTLGTPRYMAPEQLDKPETVDHRADIYSLGVVFYEMLTGEVPMGRFAPPSEKVRIDVRLDEIVLHALERDVERRYQHASQLGTDVENVTGKPAAPTPSAPPPAADVRPFSGEPRISRRAIIGAVWAVFGLLAILSGAFFIALNRVWNGTALPTDIIYARPPIAFTFFMGALLVIGSGAYIGTTVLGAVAVGQIRRSGGKIIGLPLAVADVLFFPLLGLGVLVTILVTGVIQSFVPSNVFIKAPPGIAVALVVCFFVARAAWRSIAGTGAARAAAGSEARAGSAGVVADGYRKVRAPAETLLLVAGVSLLTALGIAGWLWASSALHPESDFHPGRGQQGVAIIAMSVTLAIHAVFIGAAGLLMRRLRARFFVLVCVVLVGLFIPAVLALNCIMEAKNIPQWPVFTTTWLGMPACLWVVLILFRDDVRAASTAAANVRRPDASQSSGETRLSVANANQASGIGRISLWMAIAGVTLPVLLAQGARLFAPSQRLSDFFVLCFVLGIVMELVALGCGIAARRTAAGKAGILTAGALLVLGTLFGATTAERRRPSEAGRMETVSQVSAAVPPLGTITNGFGVQFTVPAGQVAIFEIVTRKDSATVPLPNLAAYVIAPAEQSSKGTFRWSREPVDFSSGTHRQPWRIEVLTPGGGRASSGGLDLPEALEAVVGSMSLGLGLEPDREDIHWAGPDTDKLPADGLVGLRVRTQAHGIKAGMPGSAGGSGAATSDWQKARNEPRTTL